MSLSPVNSNWSPKKIFPVERGGLVAGFGVPEFHEADALEVTRVLVAQPPHGLHLGVDVVEEFVQRVLIDLVTGGGGVGG